MIQVENLTKYYGDLAAIKDASFNVDKGETLAFLGQVLSLPRGLIQFI
jgi:ABC-type multidrug transport system ATPase subunit